MDDKILEALIRYKNLSQNQLRELHDAFVMEKIDELYGLHHIQEAVELKISGKTNDPDILAIRSLLN